MNNQGKIAATVAYVMGDYKIVINRGVEQGVKVGDTYLIYAIGPEMIDPETDESLGALEIVKGRAVVRHVQEKVSTLETIEFDETPGQRKIIKRDGGGGIGGGILALSLGLGNREEIEEGPQRNQRPLDSQKGDLAKLLASK
jgi:hypothetical protein